MKNNVLKWLGRVGATLLTTIVILVVGLYLVMAMLAWGPSTFAKKQFVRKMCTEGMNMFLESRKGDVRTNEVNSLPELKEGNIFYITCIDSPKKLMPLYDKYKDKYHCVYQTDIYTNEQWLEIVPLEASKSNAIKQLQSMLNCEKLIVFGDGKNDIDMFQMADKSYAVANAHNDLKQFATEVILSNDEDGVARWLEANYKQ